MTDSYRPLLAITLGDPAGIGPEVILKALQHADVYERARPLVIGDRQTLERAAAWVDATDFTYEVVNEAAEGSYTPGVITLLDLATSPEGGFIIGQETAEAGEMAVQCVFTACDLAMAGKVDAVVTAPLNKASMHMAGHTYPGHTELLAIRTNADKVSMLLVGPTLRVVHVSTHVALEEAIRRVTPERVEQVIDIAQQSCQAFGIEQPRIAVAGLNPHASEGGLFGNQEATAIVPAISAARARGLDVSDPQPPDTVFLKASRGGYDIVVAMYHDQGHIPMKLLAFDEGVNVSVGLPIIRTSVDHGTAFDIAGTGVASETSMLAAIDVAIQLSQARPRDLRAG
ncbi:MAG TPA: 4-hydroxythreonine-4-phosphate dehydrogenase PdxA [Thermomicrobiales bacterium]|nr:4-hydroxythreonine-4-phosphate dehydrogenase PdxA [Thermomicrobiales bacterium]